MSKKPKYRCAAASYTGIDSTLLATSFLKPLSTVSVD